MTFEVFNSGVLKFCSMAAFTPDLFLHTKASWFDLTPLSCYTYKLTELILEKYSTFDDITISKARVNDHDVVMQYVRSKFKEDTDVLQSIVYEKLDYEVNSVLRDIAQGKKNDDYFNARLLDLRETIKTSYDNYMFTVSLTSAQKTLKNGGSIDEAYAMLKLPEDHTVMEYDFINQITKIFGNSIAEPIKTGIEYIDREGGFERSNIITVGGDTGGMKTRWTLWLTLRILRNNPGFKCVFFD